MGFRRTCGLVGPHGLGPRVEAGLRPAGGLSLGVDVSGLAAGVYAVRVTAGGAVQTRPLVVVR